MAKTDVKKEPCGILSVDDLSLAIEKLPEGPIYKSASGNPVWYKTQKEHWLGWLQANAQAGRDARYIYSHIVNHHMLLWLIEAAGVEGPIVEEAHRVGEVGKTMMQKAGAIRKVVPWETLCPILGRV